MLTCAALPVSRELFEEVVAGAVRAAAHQVCECGCVNVDPEFAAKHVLNRLENIGMRLQSVPEQTVRFSGSAPA